MILIIYMKLYFLILEDLSEMFWHFHLLCQLHGESFKSGNS